MTVAQNIETVIDNIADQIDSKSLEKVTLSDKAWSQLTILRKIFNQTTTGNEDTEIQLYTRKRDNLIGVRLFPISSAMSKKTGLSKGYVETYNRMSSPLLGGSDLSELFNLAIDELYDRVMKPGTVIVFNHYDEIHGRREAEALFIVKDGKLHFGLE